MFPVLRRPLIFTHMILILHCQHALCGFPVKILGFLRRNVRSCCLRYQRSTCTHDQEGHRQGRQSRRDTRFIQGVCGRLLTASQPPPRPPLPQSGLHAAARGVDYRRSWPTSFCCSEPSEPPLTARSESPGPHRPQQTLAPSLTHLCTLSLGVCPLPPHATCSSP